MNWITENFIKENISYKELIEELKQGFRDDVIECPPKLAYNYKSSFSQEDNTLLFMPAWDNKKFFGVKLITATPKNKDINLPYLNGVYVLFNSENGEPLVIMNAKLITNIRTAATSVLASQYLAKETASSVLILGNGSLSTFYIEAYASMPNIDTVYLWGRNLQKSKEVIASIIKDKVKNYEAIEDFSNLIKKVDIISCITSSKKPLVKKRHMSSGQHFDLAGSYTENMQEVSTKVISNSSVYTDNYNITLQHAGEFVKAIKKQKFNKTDVKGDLKFLCKDDSLKRNSKTENTLFKSTGMAIEDLIIAVLIYKKFNKNNA